MEKHFECQFYEWITRWMDFLDDEETDTEHWTDEFACVNEILFLKRLIISAKILYSHIVLQYSTYNKLVHIDKDYK